MAFITLEEAAERLGITADKVSQLRESGKLRGFRDGGSWKFKDDDINRMAEELKSGGSQADDQDDMLDLDLDLDDDDDIDAGADSILLSEREMGQSAGSPSSTIIGKEGTGDTDSDVQISDDAKSGASDVKLEDDASMGSDVRLAGTSDVLGGEDTSIGTGSGSQFEALDELEAELEGEPSKLGSSGADELTLNDEDLTLSEDDAADASDLTLHADNAAESDSDKGSGSTLELADDEDDELVLGEGSGSDITLSSEDSGIGLTEPTDSGLSLEEEPLELGGSQVESLELGEDDDILLDADADDSEAATQLKADDDFLLTPLDDGGGEETEDSGSQVIALDSESFDESADTLLGEGVGQADAALADELGGGGAAPLGAGSAAMLSPHAAVPEAPYSIWNVLSLMLCFVMLGLAGMMMYDLLRNMWSWNEPYVANSAVMDELMELIPIFKK